MEILVIWTVVAIVAAIVARNKGRSGAGWFFLCVLLTPLALLVLLALPTLKPPEPQPVRLVGDVSDEPTKICPQCAETVKAAARICHFCGYKFPESPASSSPPSGSPTPPNFPNGAVGFGHMNMTHEARYDDAQRPPQPHRDVVVDRPVRLGDGAYIEVVRPSARRGAMGILRTLAVAALVFVGTFVVIFAIVNGERAPATRSTSAPSLLSGTTAPNPLACEGAKNAVVDMQRVSPRPITLGAARAAVQAMKTMETLCRGIPGTPDTSADLTKATQGLATMEAGCAQAPSLPQCDAAERSASAAGGHMTNSAELEKDAALAKEAGTTPDVIARMRQEFGRAGISAEGFDALIENTSRQVKEDYPDMMENIRTSAARQAEAARRVQEAKENLRRAYGLPPD